jgi:uncharacterized membrane protein YeaQ/YmgE (transglycosylase-associated protein family)
MHRLDCMGGLSLAARCCARLARELRMRAEILRDSAMNSVQCYPRGDHPMGFLSWILLGLIVGVLAKWILPGKDPGGLIVTILLGIVGAVIGGYLATLLGLGAVTGFNLGSLVIAIGGAILVLLVHRKIRG